MDAYDRKVIERLREVRRIKHISYQKIYDTLEERGQYVSMSTIRRVFTSDLDKVNFRYEYSIEPIAELLLQNEGTSNIQIYNFIKHLKMEIDSFYEYIAED